jgi:hypothetical protein
MGEYVRHLTPLRDDIGSVMEINRVDGGGSECEGGENGCPLTLPYSENLESRKRIK